MRIALHEVRVDGRRGPMLPEMSLDWATGECVLVAAEPGHGHTALALVATGRLAPSAGFVSLDRRPADGDELRDLTSVVDVPGVTEPDDALPVRTVVAEQLALAGRRALRRDVDRWLAEHSLGAERRQRVDQLPAVVRTATLAALAAERRATRFLVLTLPDRHGGPATDWWQVGCSLAASGYGVLVQCTRASARELGAELVPARGGAAQHEPPVLAMRTRPEPLVLEAPHDDEPDPPGGVDALTASRTDDPQELA